MVNYEDPTLDRIFAALGDPTRRAILARLEREPAVSVSELARPFAIKLPAVMKHLDVLAGAGLIRRGKTGRTVSVELEPEPMRAAMAWLNATNGSGFSSRPPCGLCRGKGAGRMTSLTLVRQIKARPSIVYEAFTRPEQIARWWGPDAGPVLVSEADVRVGGRFRVRFRMLDGSEHESTGAYLEVTPNERLVFTWRWVGEEDPESKVTVELRPVAGGAELTFTHAMLPDEEARISHQEGWTGAIDKLERLFEPA